MWYRNTRLKTGYSHACRRENIGCSVDSNLRSFSTHMPNVHMCSLNPVSARVWEAGLRQHWPKWIKKCSTFSTVNKQESVESEQMESVGLPRAEVIKRLRERGHPILLYAENELQSFKRLRRIEIQEPEANRVSNT